jgi:hypothetical protein
VDDLGKSISRTLLSCSGVRSAHMAHNCLGNVGFLWPGLNKTKENLPHRSHMPSSSTSLSEFPLTTLEKLYVTGFLSAPKDHDYSSVLLDSHLSRVFSQNDFDKLISLLLYRRVSVPGFFRNNRLEKIPSS